jgi:hypothetical protein
MFFSNLLNFAGWLDAPTSNVSFSSPCTLLSALVGNPILLQKCRTRFEAHLQLPRRHTGDPLPSTQQPPTMGTGFSPQPGQPYASSRMWGSAKAGGLCVVYHRTRLPSNRSYTFVEERDCQLRHYDVVVPWLAIPFFYILETISKAPLSPRVSGIEGQTHTLSDPPLHVDHGNAIYSSIGCQIG